MNILTIYYFGSQVSSRIRFFRGGPFFYCRIVVLPYYYETRDTVENYFEGYYFKHQKGGRTLCLIAGSSGGEKFIQVITDDFSVNVPFSKGNIFSPKGVRLDIRTPQLSLAGKIRYGKLSPIRYDIMGPFKFFPMECRHGIVSMHHRLEGKVMLNGEMIDFTGGLGYIEKDSGRSFPSSYVWMQANDFFDGNRAQPCSIVASVASIPFFGLRFRGCICVIQYGGREYRLATYLGVRVISCTEDTIILKQRKYRLEIRVKGGTGRNLSAPKDGKMTRTIQECAACPAEFRFYHKERLIFDLHSQCASYEYESGAPKSE